MWMKNSWWLKFDLGGSRGEGLFVRFSLECPVCKDHNPMDTTGYEIGQDRSLSEAVENILKEVASCGYECSRCGVSSKIAPPRHLEDEIKDLAEELTEAFFQALPFSDKPAKVQGICIN
jgi:hypothetical protein